MTALLYICRHRSTAAPTGAPGHLVVFLVVVACVYGAMVVDLLRMAILEKRGRNKESAR
jgi:hypothetical protein